jgi:tripartite motif-containing protein 71
MTVGASPVKAQVATHLFNFGSSGGGNGQFLDPSTIDIDLTGGNLFVGEFGKSRVQRFDLDGTFQQSINVSGLLMGMGVNRVTGDLYVAKISPVEIRRFDRLGNFELQFGADGALPGQFSNVLKMAIRDSNGHLYLSEDGNHRIQRLDADGNFVGMWGREGSGPGLLNRPFSVAIDQRNGRIFVADFTNNRIQRFSSAGEFELEWGGPGTQAGFFDEPFAVAVDSKGRVFVADLGNSRVQRFTSEGRFEFSFGVPGADEDDLTSPTDLVVDGSRIYVVDNAFDRVSVWQINDRPTLGPIGGLKRTVRSTKARIAGNSTDATRVEFRVGNRGAFRRAKLSGSLWSINLTDLRKGTNLVQVKATGPGGTSDPIQFRIVVK